MEYEADDFTEVILQDGTIERVVMPEGFTEAIDEDEFEKEIKSDPIYKMLNERRKYRLSMVIVSGVCTRMGTADFVANSLFS